MGRFSKYLEQGGRRPGAGGSGTFSKYLSGSNQSSGSGTFSKYLDDSPIQPQQTPQEMVAANPDAGNTLMPGAERNLRESVEHFKRGEIGSGLIEGGKSLGFGVLEGMAIPWNVATRGLTAATQTALGSGPSQDKNAMFELMENYQKAQPGFSEPIKEVGHAIGGNEGAWMQPEGYFDVAANVTGLVGDFFLDPLNKATKVGALSKMGRSNEAIAREAGRLGYKFDDTGNLMKSVQGSGDEVADVAASGSEVLDTLLKEAKGTGNKKQAKFYGDLLKDMRKREGAAPTPYFTKVDTSTMTPAGRRDAGIDATTMLGVDIKPLNTGIDKMLRKASGGKRGRLRKDEIEQAKDALLPYLGSMNQFTASGRNQLFRMIDETPEFLDELNVAAKDGPDAVKELFGEVFKKVEANPYEVMGVSDIPLSAADDFSGLIKSADMDLSPTGMVAGKARKLLDDMLEEEIGFGVASKLRPRLTEQAQSLVEESVKRGDYATTDEAMESMYKLMDEYQSPQHFLAGRGFEKHSAFPSRPDMPMGIHPDSTKATDVFDPDTLRQYMPRPVSRDAMKKLDKVLPKLDAANPEDMKAINAINYLRNPNSTEQLSKLGIKVPASVQRGTKGERMDFADIQQFWADEINLNNEIQEKLGKTLGRFEGVFESNPFAALERRVDQSSKMKAGMQFANKLATNKKAFGDFVKAGDSPFLDPLTNIQKKGVRLQEVVPGIPSDGRFKDVYIHPDAADMLKSATTNLTSPSKVVNLMNDYMNFSRKWMLGKPKTAIRNAIDSSYKNFVVYGEQAIPAMDMARRAMGVNEVNITKPKGVKGDTVSSQTRYYTNTLTDGVKNFVKTKAGGSPKEIVTNTGEVLNPQTLADEMNEVFVFTGGMGNRYNINMDKAMYSISDLDRLNKGTAKNLGQSISRLPDKTLYFSSMAEDFGRATSYVAERMAGKGKAEAAMRAHGVHWTSALPDDMPVRLAKLYPGATPDSIRHFTNSMFSFFYFHRKNYPFWAKQMLKTPGRANFPVKLKETYDKTGATMPPEEYMSDLAKTTPYALNIRESRDKRGRKKHDLMMHDLSNMLSQLDVVNPQKFSLGAQVHPVPKLLLPFEKGSLWELAGGDMRMTHPYFDRKMSPRETATYISSQLFPPAQWARRPMEAAGLTEKMGLEQIYPDESFGSSLYQTFGTPATHRKMNLEYRDRLARADARKIMAQLEREGKRDTDEYRKQRDVASGRSLRQYIRENR